MMTLSIAEVLDALRSANPGPPDEDIPPLTYSGTEIQRALGWGHIRFHDTMRAWLRDGTCRLVTYRKRAIDGRLANVKGYQFTAPAKAPPRKRAA